MFSEFDIIIVGAGSAGCALAYRLSENPGLRVLVLERGGEGDGLLFRMPAGLSKLIADPRYTAYFEVENPHRNAKMMVPRGAVLGGSSSINGMIWLHGHPEDYDEWEALGNPGWGWRDMAPIFERIVWRGKERPPEGRMPIALPPQRLALAEAWIEAFAALGVPRLDGLTRGNREGAEYNLLNCIRGERWSAARAFLAPARKRPNVCVETQFEVDRILFEGRRAVGVSGRKNGKQVIYRTRGEVILSANAYASPRLLQISGVGPATHLRDCGVPVVADSPDVGMKMQDHVPFHLQFSLCRQVSLNRQLQGWRLAWNGMRYLLSRSGPLSVSPFWAGGAVDTTGGHDRPDAYIFLAPMSFDMSSGTPVLDKSPGMMVGGYFLRPRSLGSVLIQSAAPSQPAKIEPNSLTHPEDAAASIRVFRNIRKLAAAAPLANLIASETMPTATVESDADVLAWIGRETAGGGHTVGTCRMGTDEAAVVDPRLRVRHVEGLRVVDTAVIPRITSCNTNAPTIALAWRAADIILEDIRQR